MTTTSEDLADLMVTAMIAGRVADGNVYGIRAWPKADDGGDLVRLGLPTDDKQGQGAAGAPSFNVTATIPVIVDVSAPAEADEAGAAAVRGKLADLCRAIEVAVVNAYALTRLITRFAFIRTQGEIDASGREIQGRRVMLFGLVYFQGPEDFAPVEGDDLERLVVTVDTTAPFDRAATYPDPAFPASVTPAPRTTGPDGRAEGGLDLDLTE